MPTKGTIFNHQFTVILSACSRKSLDTGHRLPVGMVFDSPDVLPVEQTYKR